MDASVVGLLLLAGAFAVINGVNDGGALVANGLKIRALALAPAMGLLAGWSRSWRGSDCPRA